MNFIVALFIPFIFLTLSNDSVSIILTTSFPSSLFRDGPLEKLWGGGKGNFRAARIFFRYQILCMNFI